ncbi:MAG: glycosyltransferase family 39 protein [Elusimicrobiales bacterium]|jgi:4-amino-4-deoxy-L-arabinose transferase-like glycosyltransferase
MAKNKKKGSRAQAAAIPDAGRFPSWVVWPVFAAWGLLVFKNYYSRFTPDLNSLFVILSPDQYLGGLWKVVPGHFFNLLLALAFLFCSFSAGRPVLRWSGFKFFGPLEEFVFSAGTGFGLAAGFVFALSVLKLLYFWAVAAPLGLLFAAGLADLRRHPMSGGAELPAAPRGADFAAVTILLLAMLLNLAGVLSPEIFYDSLVYHLAVPNFYVINHKMTPMPYNFYSDLPFTHGMLYAAALLLKDEILAKFINYWAGILASAAVLAMGVRYFSWRAGLWGALIFYTVAHAMIASWSAGTEALLTLFSTLAVYAVLNRSEEERGWLWLAAVFSGLAMGVKYTGFFTALGVMAAYAYARRFRPASAVKELAAFTLIASLLVGPWLVKNYIYTGNPVHPFAMGVFRPGDSSDPQKLANFASQAAQLDGSGVGTWLARPWKITMGRMANSEYFSPLFIFLLPLAFLLAPSLRPLNRNGASGPPCPPSPAALRGLWLFFLVVWGAWSVTSTMVRFLMPVYPAAGLIIAAYLFAPGHKALKTALKTAVLAACLTGVYWSSAIFYSEGRWRPLAGAVGKDEYLARTQPAYPYSSYACLKYINEKLPPDAKVLFVGDERSFYMKKNFVVSSVYDKTALVEYAAVSKTGDELYERLKTDGFTHLLLNVAEGIRLGRGYNMFYFDAGSLRVFNEFWARHIKEAYFNDETQDGRVINRTAVYELVSVRDGSSPPPYNFMDAVILKGISAK